MPSEKISADTCVRLVETATRTCQPVASAQPTGSTPNWDAMANSFASLSNAFALGSLALGVIALFGGIGWGWFVKIRAEREAREEARRCTAEEAERLVRKWLEEEALPLLRREMEEFRKTFPQESSTSPEEVDMLVAALGAVGKEDGNGK